jgi:hypothetical protein
MAKINLNKAHNNKVIMDKFKWEILNNKKIKVKRIKKNKVEWCRFNNNSQFSKIKEIQEVRLKRKSNE